MKKRKAEGLNRRRFLAGAAVGALATSLRGPFMNSGVAAQGRGRIGTPRAPSPPAVPAPSGFPGTGKFLYVANDLDRRIDVFTTTHGEHSLLWSIPWGDAVNAAGLCVDLAAHRVFLTTGNEGILPSMNLVMAFDLRSGKKLWEVDTQQAHGLRHPYELSVTLDGKTLYVPMNWSRATNNVTGWDDQVVLVLNAADGAKIGEILRPGRPHNSWTGEKGQYVYLSGRADQTVYLADPKTHKIVKKIGPFQWPVRPFVADAQEQFLYANLTRSIGFGVADIQSGKVLPEVQVDTPEERTRYWSASWAGGGNMSLPKEDIPFSHGLAIRPGGAGEVWIMNCEWGYLHVFDIKGNRARPKFKGHVALFDKIDAAWALETQNRCVAFSLDGKYCYPGDGLVVDCVVGKKTSMTIPVSEKVVEVEFATGTAVHKTGSRGGMYANPMLTA